MKKSILLPIIAAACCFGLSSCLIQQAVMAFVRDEFPGPRPPRVIADINGKPASANWLQINPNDLPPSSLVDTTLSYGPDGVPYGISSEYSNVVLSPYSPHYQLDYTGVSVGTKVWDPYTRKPFYIPRAYTFN